MRIDYDVTEAEYLEASIAGQSLMAKAAARPKSAGGRWRRFAAIGYLLLTTGIVIALEATSLRREMRTQGRDAIYLAIGRLEWLLPWLVFFASSIVVGFAQRRGRRWVGWAAALIGLMFACLAAAVAFAELASRQHLLLGGLGATRLIPWLLVGITLALVLFRLWRGTFQRRFYATSPYAQGVATLTIDEVGVRDEQVGVTHLWRWAALGDVRQTDRLLLILNRGSQPVVLLPTRAIGSPDEVKSLHALLASRAGGADPAFAMDLPIAVAVPDVPRSAE